MSVQKFDQWASKITQSYPLSTLKDSVIGVDASYYLDLRLNSAIEEPLKHALGGTPFCLKKDIEEDLEALREAGVSVIFVFNGLDFVNKTASIARSSDSVKAQEDGWRHYMTGEASKVVSGFSRAKYSVESMYRLLQQVLFENNVQYIVAPYSATAQLCYLAKLPEQYIDAVLGSTECFLYNLDKVIISLDITQSTFEWLSKSSCEERLKVPGDVVRDAHLLLGTSYTPTFPLLERMPPNKLVTITDAIGHLNGMGRSVLQLCNFHRDDPEIQNLQYADRYKKAIMTIKHHVVLETNGIVAPLDFDHAPGDVHEFVGQRLPEELFFYISKGMLGTQITNWLTSGEIELTLPGGVMDSEPYRRLVIEQLNPLRTEALKILAESLHYYYQSRIIKIKSWDGRDTQSLTITLKETAPLKSKMLLWKVRGSDITDITSKAEQRPPFLSCLQSLKDPSFAKKTTIKQKIEHPALKTKDEIIFNVTWRFLHIRGYLDDNHELTKWGTTLETALKALDPSIAPEESIIIAVELLRLGLLNGNFVTGAPVQSTDKAFNHKVNTNLLSKVACLGRFKHKAMGYVGPLDRQLLSFAWMVTAVRTSLRDLVETVLVSMFLNGEADRDRNDWSELAQSFSFISDNGSALGVAVKSYLDALDEAPEITDELKEQIKGQEGKYNWFAQVKEGTLTKNLDLAWTIWDAINAGAQHAEVKEAKLFSEANEWLAKRR